MDKQKQVDELVAERVKWLNELQQQRSTANSALDKVEVSQPYYKADFKAVAMSVGRVS